MTFSFHPEAEEEFNAALDYYEDREIGLGYDFSAEVFTALQNIINYPPAWPIIEDDVRRCLVNRFPFGVLYSVEHSEMAKPQRVGGTVRPGPHVEEHGNDY